jgi:lipopolysaccharide transport protein LptA
MKKNKYYPYFLIFFFFWTNSVQADLLDEEETPSLPVSSESEPSKDQAAPAKAPSKKNPTSQQVEPNAKKASATQPKSEASKSRNSKKAQAKSKEPVHFESKGLKGLREKGLVELVDDVVVTQGDLRLEADKAQVFFDEAAHDVVKVIADGNVKIFNIDQNTGEKLKAYGNQVVFLNKERRVIMEGNARLWRGEDSVIRGKKITYEMETGWIRADRVAGELSPSEKDKK